MRKHMLNIGNKREHKNMGLFKDLFGEYALSEEQQRLLSADPSTLSEEDKLKVYEMSRGMTPEEKRAAQMREWRRIEELKQNENTKTL